MVFPSSSSSLPTPPLIGANNSNTVVNLIATWSNLLSGGLDDCYTVDDESCEGGIAAVTAYARNLTNDAPTLVVPRLDKQSQFVQVHPLGWTVNRLVFHQRFGISGFVSTPSLLLQNAEDYGVSTRDISDLQTHDMPLLLTNADVPPSNSWHEYTSFVHFDASTGIALISIGPDGEPLSWSQIDSAVGALNYIADQNIRLGCSQQNSAAITMTFYDQYLLEHDNNDSEGGGGIRNKNMFKSRNKNCWIPVIYYSEYNSVNFHNFLTAITEDKYFPSVIMDVSGNDANYSSPTQVGSNGVWVVSYEKDDSAYYHLQFTLNNGDNENKEVSRDTRSNSNLVQNVTLILRDLEELPEELKDDIYADDILYLRRLADEAQQNDPVVGLCSFMPVARSGTYRRCQGGECEIGNLFTDSLRWYANSDIAFITSGGLRGTGWDEGDVHVSNIWASLPFPNTMCTGVMSGVSLFKLLDYSIRTATFESETSSDGGRLLQVSGIRVVYNTRYGQGYNADDADEHRILSIDVWNSDIEEYLPIDRLQLYKFASDSFLCGAYDPYPDLLGANGNFIIEGEEPGVIGEILHQNIVGEFLAHRSNSNDTETDFYIAGIEGRLVNKTDDNTIEALDLIHSERSCRDGTYWVAAKQTCFVCPSSEYVTFSDERMEFSAVQGNIDQQEGRILLVNRELFNFSVVPKTVPSWVTLTSLVSSSNVFLNLGPDQAAGIDNQTDIVINNNSNMMNGANTNSNDDNINNNVTNFFNNPVLMRPGDSIEVNFLVRDPSVDVGTALSTVSFGILNDNERFGGCDGHNRDATFDVFMRITPGDQLNQLGFIRIAGFILMGIILCTAIFFAVWTKLRRKLRIVKVMQPIFLITICCGVIIASLTILPLSIDDGIASVEACDVACMATPWLLSTGITIVFSALFSKLWRINRLFSGSSFRRVTVTVKDVIGPFVILFVVNFSLLLAWTLLDPYHWERRSVTGEEWNSYGVCVSSGLVGNILMILTCVVNVGALASSCVEAYKARNISSEFSEGKYLYLALYICAQILVVAGPVLLLIDDDNITAIYFLSVGVIFTCAMTMLMTVFVPILRHIWKDNNPTNDNDFSASVTGRTYISGLYPPPNVQSKLANFRQQTMSKLRMLSSRRFGKGGGLNNNNNNASAGSRRLNVEASPVAAGESASSAATSTIAEQSTTAGNNHHSSDDLVQKPIDTIEEEEEWEENTERTEDNGTTFYNECNSGLTPIIDAIEEEEDENDVL